MRQVGCRRRGPSLPRLRLRLDPHTRVVEVCCRSAPATRWSASASSRRVTGEAVADCITGVNAWLRVARLLGSSEWRWMMRSDAHIRRRLRAIICVNANARSLSARRARFNRGGVASGYRRRSWWALRHQRATRATNAYFAKRGSCCGRSAPRRTSRSPPRIAELALWMTSRSKRPAAGSTDHPMRGWATALSESQTGGIN